jgi:hypothetical protein
MLGMRNPSNIKPPSCKEDGIVKSRSAAAGVGAGGVGPAPGDLITCGWGRGTGGSVGKAAAVGETGDGSQAAPGAAGKSWEAPGAKAGDAAFGNAGGAAGWGDTARGSGCGATAVGTGESGLPQKPQNLAPAGNVW